MGRIVRIDSGTVVEMFDAMPVLSPVLMDQIRDDAPDDVAQGWTFDGTAFAPPAGQTIGAAKGFVSNAIDEKAIVVLATGYADAITGKAYQCDAASIGRWNAVGSSALAALVLNVTPAPSYTLIAADNTEVTLSAADTLTLLNGRVMPWVSGVIFHARAHKNAVGALTDAAAVLAYDFNGGW